jgi:hypothetical protein
MDGVLGLRCTNDRHVQAASGRRERSRGHVRLPPNPIIDFREETVGELAVHDDDYVTPHVELDWHPNDDWLVYGSWSRGVKSAGFNQDPGLNGPRDPTTIPVDKEELDAYELGFKSTLADGKVRFNAAAFYYDYNDFQAFTFGPPEPAFEQRCRNLRCRASCRHSRPSAGTCDSVCRHSTRRSRDSRRGPLHRRERLARRREMPLAQTCS